MLTNFEFISSNDNDSRKKARRHVLKEHWRRKREKESVRWQSGQDATVVDSALSNSRNPRHVRENVAQEEAALNGSELGLGKRPSTDISRPRLRQKNAHALGSRHVHRDIKASLEVMADFDPRSVLGQDHRDPFDSLPVATSRQERYLVYHCQSLLSLVQSLPEGPSPDRSTWHSSHLSSRR